MAASHDFFGAERTLSVKHYWNQLNTTSGTYNTEAIKGATAAYAHPLGLKTSTSFLSRLNQGQANWSVDRTENYAYDADFDYLTSVDYNDGLANEVQSWGYNATGNRVSDSAKPGSWTYDNLNRMSGSPMASYTHDAVGNRLTKVVGGNTTSYGWDAVNRMIESGPLTGSRHHYTYRADGMRVRKEIPGLVEKVYYDGQMPVETFEDFSTGSDKLTRNFVGARGLEMMETTVSGATTQAYPLYDTHGNMVATLSKDSAGTSWNLANERSYDVWGSVRSGAATGGPKGRYVANLGHVADDESGLIYMRARYYEPDTGRFVSEDPAKDGTNFFTYCKNAATVYVDADGRVARLPWVAFGASIFREFSKGLGSEKGVNWVSVVVRGAQGYVVGLMTSWAIKMIAYVWTQAIANATALNGGSMGIASVALFAVAAYATLIILALDALAIGGTEALIDRIFPELEQ